MSFNAKQRPRSRTSLHVVVLLSVSTIVLAAPARAQEPRFDVVFRNMPLRDVIIQLASSPPKSVAFDRAVRERRSISFEARAVSKSDALAEVLRCEHLYAVELGSVLIVAPDTAEARANYTPQRIEECRIDGNNERRGDVVLPKAPLEAGLRALARENGREARFVLAIVRDPREYDLALREVTPEEALQVFCLVTHVGIVDDGEVLIFTRYVGRPGSRATSRSPCAS